MLHIVAVCGLGMGSSLIMKMTIQSALDSLGVDAKVFASYAVWDFLS